MQSGILILVKKALKEEEAKTVSAAIYKGTSTATVSFNPQPGRAFIVKFDPEVDSPAQILSAARTVCEGAVIVSG